MLFRLTSLLLLVLSLTTIVLSAPTSTVLHVRPTIISHSETAKEIELDLPGGQHLKLSLSANTFHVHSSINITDACGYFTGGVLGGKGWATLSICTVSNAEELTGMIVLDDHTYTIQPSESTSSDAHVIIKQQPMTKSHCSMKDTLPSSPSSSPSRLKRHEHHVIEKTIEVALVVEKSLLDLHQDKLTKYLLDIMNTVSHLFRHPSTGAVIDVALTGVVIWNSTMVDISSVTHPTELRDNFCEWKSKELNVSHDIAVLLTRNSICESTNDCGILGITNYRSICDSSKSCAVIKDTGLSTSFTIAHEIGHSLGVYHDGMTDCFTDYYLMSPSFQQTNNPHEWSECSKTQLYNFLSSSDSHCLDNHPTSTVAPMTSSAPLIGTNYTLDNQCQLLYGPGTISCSRTNCSELWCSNIGGSCDLTQHSPPADGSTCSLSSGTEGGVCYQGACRQRGDVSRPVDGGWGQWGAWSQCSSSCGDGIQASHRKCDSPTPQYGGSNCVGETKRYRICHMTNCPSDTKDYREEHCNSLDSGHDTFVSGQSHKGSGGNGWIPVHSRELVQLYLNPCKLYCQKDDSYYLIHNSLPDGISCLTHNYKNGVCINNHCVQIGCDGHLGTPNYIDKCGVQCGDGTTCEVVTNTFTPTGLVGDYQDIVTLPPGTKEIEFDHTSSSNNLLAAYGTQFQLNSPSNRPYPYHIIHFAGTTWHYGFDSNHRNFLHSNGPTNQSIVIKVHIQDRVPISYTFAKPLKSKWNIGKWSNCSTLCGNCTVTREVNCFPSGGCDDHDKPSTSRTHIQEPCDHFRWEAGEWSECEVHQKDCGDGSKHRTVTCNHTNGTVVNDGYCTGNKPVHEVSCVKECKVCKDKFSKAICEAILKFNQCQNYKSNCCETCN